MTVDVNGLRWGDELSIRVTVIKTEIDPPHVLVDIKGVHAWIPPSDIERVLPRPIKVGDKVRFQEEEDEFTVIALDGPSAWVKSERIENFRCTIDVDYLELVSQRRTVSEAAL